MLKVAFASPPLGLKERYGSLAPLGGNMPALALLSLAAIAVKKGFESCVIPAGSLGLDYDRIIRRISGSSPDCLAITSTTSSTIWPCMF